MSHSEESRELSKLDDPRALSRWKTSSGLLRRGMEDLARLAAEREHVPQLPVVTQDASDAQKTVLATLDVPVDLIGPGGIQFKRIPPGEFLMGSSLQDVRAEKKDLKRRSKDHYLRHQYLIFYEKRFLNPLLKTLDFETQHLVRIPQPFYLGVYAVTQGEFQKLMGRNPSAFSTSGEDESSVVGMNTGRFPVESVSWFDAVEFCNKLSEADGRTPFYRLTNIERDADQSINSATVSFHANEEGDTGAVIGYRLPTEAEWEYACRAGTITLFHFGNTFNGDNANVDGFLSLGRTTAVDEPEYPKNAFGLAQMHGNVWEWCADVYDQSAYLVRSLNTATVNPLVTTGSGTRVLRGGSWLHHPTEARSAYRSRGYPSNRIGDALISQMIGRDYRSTRSRDVGFRVVLPVAVR